MVKTPRTRHAKSSRPPVTIDLEASASESVSESDVSPRLPENATLSPAAEAREAEALALAPEEAATPAPETPFASESHGAAAEAREAEALAEAPGEAATTTTEMPNAIEPLESAVEAPPANPDKPEDFSTETGTSIPPEQEYRSAESLDAIDDKAPDHEPVLRDEPKPNATPVPPQTVARKDGLGRIAAGVIGGVVVLAVAGGMQAAGLLGYPGAGGSADSSAEIASLRTEIEALKSTSDGSETAARVDELSQGLDSLRAEFAAFSEAAPAAGATGENLGPRLDALETEISRMSSGMATPQALAALGERVAATETQARSAEEASASATDRLSVLEQSVSSLTARVDAQAQQPKIALAIATAALKAAVDRGAPFLAELETFAAIHPDLPELETLREFAESGVPTREALRAGMDAAANAMIAATIPADADAGFLDRLMDSAESLVSVRPIGEVSGSGVPETVARMEVAMNAGELDKALAEYETLPDPIKQAGAAFATQLRARAQVERLVDQAIATAMRT